MDINQEKIQALAEKYNLSLVVLFGSQATGKVHKQSDYDIAYTSKYPLTPKEEGALIVDLMPVLRTIAVDLVNIRNAPPLLLKEIAQDCVVLYEREQHLCAQFRIYAYKRYMEATRLFRLRSDYLDRVLHNTTAP